MRVTRLTATNFKGSSFEEELAPVTLFTGPNSCGKSSRLEALQLALAGYVPGVPERPRELYEALASGPSMSVEAIVQGTNQEPTFCFVRTWRQVQGEKVTSETNGCDSAAGQLGFYLDPELFFGLTARERTKELVRASGAATRLDKSKLALTLSSQLKRHAGGYVSQGPEANVFGLLAATAEQVVKTALNSPSKSALDWLDDLSGEAAAKVSSAKANLKRMEGALEADTQNRSLFAKPGPPPDPDAEAKLAVARKALSEFEKEVAGMDGRLDELRRQYREMSKSKLEEAVETLKEEEQKLADLQESKACPTCGKERDPAEVRAAVAKQKRAVAAAKKAVEGTKVSPEMVKELEALQAEAGGINSKKVVASQEVAKAHAEVKKLEVEVRALESSRAAEQARAASAVQAEAFRAELTASKRFQEAVDALKEEVLAQGVGPLLAKLNELCSPILPAPVAFKDGELYLEGRGRTHRSASDSEKLLLYAALCVALGAGSKLKVVAVGRLESFDRERKLRLASLLIDLVDRGEIDQAVLVEVGNGTDWGLHTPHTAHFKLVNLSPPKPKANTRYSGKKKEAAPCQ